ncbi:MAG TPA: sigma-70 family RNA polymerase sigma factor [Actinomycetota bacterium]|nr:sigma-70 family RNA polymerase sigma factor [Actinomycetota bacterium]
MVHAARSSRSASDVLPGDGRAVSRVEEWFRQYADTRDPAVRERIIVAYLGLADRLADRYRSSRGVSPEDLPQTARVGLVAAVDRYDPDHGNSFVPYAVACVVGEIKRDLRDTSWRVHVSRPAKERSLRVLRALDELPHTLGRSPTVTELADHLGLSEDDALEAIEVAHTRQEVSLDQRVGEDGDTSLGDRLPAAPPREEPEDLFLLPGLVDSLPEPERQIVVLRFFHDLDQYEIAGRVGCSQMHVSRLLRRALDRMRTQLLVP